jgi:hypothetical protein
MYNKIIPNARRALYKRRGPSRRPLNILPKSYMNEVARHTLQSVTYKLGRNGKPKAQYFFKVNNNTNRANRTRRNIMSENDFENMLAKSRKTKKARYNN